MATAYRIVLLHRGLDALATKVEQAILDAAEDLAHIEKLLEFSNELSDDDIPQVVAYLANERGCRDEHVAGIIDAALNRDVSLLPVIDNPESESVDGKVPKCIAHLNAAFWAGQGNNVATSILEMLGLIETERKVFLSYRRSETGEMAEQFHTALGQRRFDVFLDRFAIKPGVNFQRRLEEDLSDMAFVLLLESNQLRESPWVRHEIAYAHARRIQILALTLPDCTQYVPTIDNAFRHRLSAEDISSEGMLTPRALEKTLDTIELTHARAIRRRREQILGSVTEKLRINGCECHPAADWCILATGPNGESGLFWVTPRRPDLKDFYALSQEHRRVMQKGGFARLKGCIVHESGRIPEHQEKPLAWLSRVCCRRLATVGTCTI